MSEIPETIKRWTAKRRVALVLELLRGDTTAAQAARKYALTVAKIEGQSPRRTSPTASALRM